MTTRKPIGTRLRFEVFKRDGFRCVYCGASPVERPLHVDHVDPVSDGGTNDPSNLVTACPDCNLGKSNVSLERKELASATLEEQQDHAEQIREYLRVQREVAEARREIISAIASYWKERIGEEPQAEMMGRFIGLQSEFGLVKLMEAIDIVAAKQLRGVDTIRTQQKQAQYFHGILRVWRESR